MAARSDHSSALPAGSASTRSTCCPASAKMCASHTADVVLPVPGLRLSRAMLKAGTAAVLQYLLHYGSTVRSCVRWHGAGCQQPVDGALEYRCELERSCRAPCGKRVTDAPRHPTWLEELVFPPAAQPNPGDRDQLCAKGGSARNHTCARRETRSTRCFPPDGSRAPGVRLA